MARAIVVGSAGQDGTILCKKLISSGVEVVGVARTQTSSTIPDFDNIPIDICHKEKVSDLVKRFIPDQVYFLAAHQHSSDQKIKEDDCDLLSRSMEVNVNALHNFLEAARLHTPHASVFYAASSHVFGKAQSETQNEATPFAPANYYAISKVAGINLCHYYRNQLNMKVCVGILYNHESIYRSENFLTVKVIKSALEISHNKRDSLVLGDLSAKVDWGSANDYTQAMQMLVENDQSDDFVIATGIQHSVLDLVKIVFEALNLDYKKYVSESEGIKARNKFSLCGDSSKIKNAVGWMPQTTFKEMILEMLYFYKDKYLCH
jgi:GDPmannose 4,6-dehydratase